MLRGAVGLHGSLVTLGCVGGPKQLYPLGTDQSPPCAAITALLFLQTFLLLLELLQVSAQPRAPGVLQHTEPAQ